MLTQASPAISKEAHKLGCSKSERLRVNTVRFVAMCPETTVLPNVWWLIRVDDASIENTLAH